MPYITGMRGVVDLDDSAVCRNVRRELGVPNDAHWINLDSAVVYHPCPIEKGCDIGTQINCVQLAEVLSRTPARREYFGVTCT